MEGMVLEIKEKVEEMENFLSSLKKRFDKLFDESGCQGDLCSCITFYKGTESQMKDLFRQMKGINNRLSEKDLEDKARDRKLEQLSKEIANMRTADTATSSKTVIPKIDSRKEKADIEPRNKAPNVTNRSRQTNERNDGNRSGERKGSSSERRRSDSRGNHDKSFDSDNEQNDTNKRLELRPESRGEKREQHKQNPGSRNRNSYTQSANLQLPRDEEPNRDNIQKPNFKHSTEVALRQPSSSATASALEQARGGLPVVERQKEKEYYLSPDVWEVEAKGELIASQKTPLRKLEKVTTILLIDTSESMAAGDTWRQVTTFVNDYVDGLEEMYTKHKTDEHLALVTFGAQTRCHQRYTNDFSLIRSAFNKLQLGGPSPLHGGLMMADAVSLTCESKSFT
ncbi:eukaryotic translation initiation factor 5B-like [Ruditapes philippinarum]|uniref:eukaryotic translation initiation factor 5B-like n=1 Tax=Ruditapes philippinarum TaxID=129788 RepID=UPI00295B0AD0|nr:eukaryotic translation initiation factor 5B-like [Ruditapes philippinarum]